MVGWGFVSQNAYKNPQTVLQEIIFSVEIQENPPLASKHGSRSSTSREVAVPPPATPPSWTPALSHASAAAWSLGQHLKEQQSITQTALHKGLPSQGAVSLTDVLPTCQPLGCSKHTQEQPGAELCLGHGSTAEQLPPAPRQCRTPGHSSSPGASSRAASDPSSLSWNEPIFLCFWSQPWEGLAVQLVDPEGYFPSYFGNLENFVVIFLAELFKLPFQRLTFRCNDYRKLFIARNSTIYVFLLRSEDPLVPSISIQCLCHISVFLFPGFKNLKTILECHKQIKLADCRFMEGQ